jgi:adenylate cyclase
MGIEIERKFLVKGDTWRTLTGEVIRQGYLCRDPQRTVRVRVSGKSAWLTIKGASQGAVRSEFDYAIPVPDAIELLALCEPWPIEKIRHRIEYAGFVWEVDEFLGANQGLVVAEIELDSVDEEFEHPAWLGDEVTQEARYFNSQLSLKPYSMWETR